MTTEQLPTIPTAVSGPALAVLEADPAELQALLGQTLGGGVTLSELDRVGMPTGGALAFTVPGITGEETRRTLVGMLVDVRQRRAYWAAEFSGGGSEPDCTSQDAITGIGDPGGSCSLCPLARFQDGAAPACRLTADMAFFAPGELLPTILTASPGSIRPVAKYLLGLAKKGLRYTDVVTEFSLERATSRSGIQFSRLLCTMVSILEPAQRSRMRAIAAMLFGEGAAPSALAAGAAAGAERVPGEDEIPEHATVDPTTDADVPPPPGDDADLPL